MPETQKPEVDVEQIMAESRRNIQMEEEIKKIPAFEDIPITELDFPKVEMPIVEIRDGPADWAAFQESQTYINSHYEVLYYWPFAGSKVKTLFKRVFRKLAKCLLLPIVQMQNAFNAHVACCVNALAASRQEKVSDIKQALFDIVNAQQETIKQLESTQAELKAALAEQTEQLQAMRLLIDGIALGDGPLHDRRTALAEKGEYPDQQRH